jgi:hypothetical protein
LRQHSSFVPFFQTRSPLPLRQLSTVCAPAADAMATLANRTAILLSLFIGFPLGLGGNGCKRQALVFSQQLSTYSATRRWHREGCRQSSLAKKRQAITGLLYNSCAV